jgi:hypothetical protein
MSADEDFDAAADCYEILGVKRSDSMDSIRATYHRLVRDLHPDRNPNNPDAAKRLKVVIKAYEALCTTHIDGAAVLDELVTWWPRFIAVTHPDDIYVLTLWTVHTHLVNELYTTPRLLIDSIMEESGKTTVIEHLQHLCVNPLQAAAVSSQALIPRLLDNGMRTVLIDEAQRSLRLDKPGVQDLLSIINTGYKKGATRPVLVPDSNGGYTAREMPTYAPVCMAGISPNLEPDTASRQIRILLIRDIHGAVQDSDWELIEEDAAELQARIAKWADLVREDIKGAAVDLPAGCIGRRKERWRPLARVAAAAGGRWPGIVTRLIEANIAEEQAEKEDGLRTQPREYVMMTDLYAVWPKGANGLPEPFMPTKELVPLLIVENPTYWGTLSLFGKVLNETALGRMITKAAKVTSDRPHTQGPRGYLYATLLPVWRQVGIAPPKEPRPLPDRPDNPDNPAHPDTKLSESSESAGLSSLFETPEPGAEPGAGGDHDKHDEAVQMVMDEMNGHVIKDGARWR